jgi:hypothetical protein
MFDKMKFPKVAIFVFARKGDRENAEPLWAASGLWGHLRMPFAKSLGVETAEDENGCCREDRLLL